MIFSLVSFMDRINIFAALASDQSVLDEKRKDTMHEARVTHISSIGV